MPLPLQGTYSPNINLYMPTIDDQIDDLVLALADNMSKIDDAVNAAGGSAGVDAAYVDTHDAETLTSAKGYTDAETDRAIGIEDTKAGLTDLENHRTDTTDVHGIPDTTALVTTTDPRLVDQRVPPDGSVTPAKLSFDPATQVELDTQVAALQLADGTRLVWRGAWAATTAYVTNDLVLAPDGGIYRAPVNFISGAVFNAANWALLVPPVNPLTFAAMADPVTPATDHLALYVKKVSGRVVPKAMAPTGISYILQASMFQQMVVMLTSNAASVVLAFACTVTTVGSGSGATNEALGARTKLTSAASAGSTAGTSVTAQLFRRGSVSGGSNGFFVGIRFTVEDADYTNSRLAIGLSNATFSATVTQDDPGNHHLLFHKLAGEANFFFSSEGTGAVLRTDTGMPVVPGHLYDAYFYCASMGTEVDWRIDDLTAGTTQEGTRTTNLPTASTPLRPGLQVGTIDAVARSISIARLYAESDR